MALRSLLPWTLAMALLGGCGGKAIREEGLALKDQDILGPFPEPDSLEIGHPGPYHAILRLSEGALAEMIETSLLGELAQGPVSLGEFPGLTPYFGAQETQVQVLETCPGCVAVSMQLSLAFEVAPGAPTLMTELLEWLATEGQTQGRLGLEGRLSLRQEGSEAFLSIGDIRLQEAEVLGAIEKGFINPRRTLERYLNSYIGETLETPTIGAALPLPKSLTVGGESLPISGLGLISLAASKGRPGELVLGVATTVTEAGDLAPYRKGGGLGADLDDGEFGVVMGEALLGTLVEREITRGSAGAPEETHVARLRGFEMSEDAIRSEVELYQVGRFPWAGIYGAEGHAAVDGDRVVFPHSRVDESQAQIRGWRRRAKGSIYPETSSHMPFAILSTLTPYGITWAEGEGADLKDAELEGGMLTLIGTLGGP